MSENLLQFVWLYRLYSPTKPLKTIDGDSLLVLHPGRLNKDAGPDFLEAKIKIGNTIWAGNIEIHLKSSDWNKHLHQHNKAYSNLILHVVYEFDADIQTKDDTSFSTLELKEHIDKTILYKYERLMQAKGFIPCEESIEHVKPLTLQLQMERMLAERLEEKTSHILDLLRRYKNNWQEVFYIQLARGFGLHINQEVFENLAMQLPLHMLGKHKNNPLQIEALLFGQAGFLNDYFDEHYPMLLQKEYAHLKKLYNLTLLEKHRWKFLRLRPANFPTIRIAQFAQLISDSSHLFSKITEANSIKELEKYFNVTVSEFWLSHYSLNEISDERTKSIGKSFIQTIIINAVVPTLFMYGKLQGKEAYCEKAIEFLRQLPPEKNSVITQWESIGIVSHSAADSQALLQLKKKYCDAKQCLSCGIGYELLKAQHKSLS